MCFIQPEWTYWACAFPAGLFNPVGADTLFTISNLVITSVFPARTQGLAGGVFNTVAQIGKSVGLATSGVIAASITEHSQYHEKESPEALMVGFRAAFWYMFALSCATGLLFIWSLKGIGKVGMKREWSSSDFVKQECEQENSSRVRREIYTSLCKLLLVAEAWCCTWVNVRVGCLHQGETGISPVTR